MKFLEPPRFVQTLYNYNNNNNIYMDNPICPLVQTGKRDRPGQNVKTLWEKVLRAIWTAWTAWTKCLVRTYAHAGQGVTAFWTKGQGRTGKINKKSEVVESENT